MFSLYVTAAILVSQNSETVVMLVSQTNPVGVELFLMQTLSFVPINLHTDAGRLSENTLYCCMMNYSQTITAENSA